MNHLIKLRKNFKMQKKTLKLKKVQRKHLDLIIKWRNNMDIMKYNTQFFLLNMEHEKKWFNEVTQKNSKQKIFVFEYDKKVIGVGGLIHLDTENRSADIAIILGDTKVHGKGLGPIILQMLVIYGFHKMNLHRIGADIIEYNRISLKLFEKLDFKKEAVFKDYLWRFGRWWKMYKYSIINY